MKQTPKQLQLTDPAEAAVVDQIEVRLIQPEERARWDALICEHHYLKNAHLVGEQLRYVAHCRGEWVALLGWSAAAYHLKHRDTLIGWDANQRRARLHLVANNARFCVLADRQRYPNLGSRALALNLQRLSEDWLAAYGHPILLVESFVDEQLFRGTVYKASGWRRVGATAGYSRVAEDFYVAHERPKQLYVRALVKHAERKLRARALPAGLRASERKVARKCTLAGEDMTSLWHVLDQHVPESRDVHGLRHRQPTVLAIVFAFLLAGGEGGHRAVALFAQDLTQKQRAALRCYYHRRKRCFDAPGENCFFRVLRSVPVRAFQLALWTWQKARLGGSDGDAVVLDGKALRGSQGTQLVGAINAANGRTLGVEPVADKSNEIPAARTLLERLELDGAVALMDALHTQVETARTVVQEGGGDYVLVIKANQSGLLEQAQNLLPEDFSPSTHARGKRAWARRMARHPGGQRHARPDGVSLR